MIDVDHRVTALYGMINVPSGVWVDEQGRIVRPAETAYSEQKTFGSIVAGSDQYAVALRDWVQRGEASAFLFDASELTRKLRRSNPERPRADAHFTMATWLHRQGEEEAARGHWQQAQRLDPDNWNYHRQEWSFLDGGTRSRNFAEKLQGQDGPYYKPADLRQRK